jgi:hypothetical protein
LKEVVLASSNSTFVIGACDAHRQQRFGGCLSISL